MILECCLQLLCVVTLCCKELNIDYGELLVMCATHISVICPLRTEAGLCRLRDLPREENINSENVSIAMALLDRTYQG